MFYIETQGNPNLFQKYDIVINFRCKVKQNSLFHSINAWITIAHGVQLQHLLIQSINKTQPKLCLHNQFIYIIMNCKQSPIYIIIKLNTKDTYIFHKVSIHKTNHRMKPQNCYCSYTVLHNVFLYVHTTNNCQFLARKYIGHFLCFPD